MDDTIKVLYFLSLKGGCDMHSLNDNYINNVILIHYVYANHLSGPAIQEFVNRFIITEEDLSTKSR